MFRRRWSIPGAAALVALGVGIAVTRPARVSEWISPPDPGLSDADDVVEMQASLVNFEFAALPAVAEFVVPAEHVPVILDWLRPAGYTSLRELQMPDTMYEMGEVVIRTKAGERVRLRFYWTGQGPVLFTRNGVGRFYGKWHTNQAGLGIDGGMKLSYAIRDASEAAGR